MNCEAYWELSASEDLTEQAACEWHLAACKNCRAQREALEAALRPWGEHPPLNERERQLWLAAAQKVQPVTLGGVSRPGPLGWAVPTLAALALALVAALVLHSTTSQHEESDSPRPPLAAASPPRFSPISAIPITVALCFGQIEQDLQASSARAEEISAELRLAEIERDVQSTLDRARRWDE